jgi:hypothetical protein
MRDGIRVLLLDESLHELPTLGDDAKVLRERALVPSDGHEARIVAWKQHGISQAELRGANETRNECRFVLGGIGRSNGVVKIARRLAYLTAAVRDAHYRYVSRTERADDGESSL